MARRHLIIAPPPTPNGDLHVGHMSGPYLAGDFYKRFLAREGITAHYVLSTDDHQSYVDTTAGRLGLPRDELVARSRREIWDSLQTYAIGVDHFGAPDGDYPAYIARYFRALSEAGLCAVRDVEVLFDRTTGTFPVEAFVSGFCPTCLDATCGGICESCGHPNACVDLVGLDRARYEVRREPRLVLDLEQFRPELDEHLTGLPNRPALARLIAALLAGRLEPFVLSYRTGRGVGAGCAGLPDQQINVWGEMGPGHMYYLEQVVGPLDPADHYVQFMGFDNSYFYVVVHVALALAGRRCGYPWPLPAAVVTNQFYALESAKFSTSKGHLVWARDLAKEFTTDAIRLFLALHGPEYQEASFVPPVFQSTAEALGARINRLAEAFNGAARPAAPTPGRPPEDVVRALAGSPSLERYSAAEAARRALSAIHFMADAVAGGNARLVPYVPALLARALDVFCPAYVDLVRRSAGLPEVPSSPPAACRLDARLPAFEVRR
jgi:methionyl-tRNA synthetase